MITLTTQAIWDALEEVPDPELPPVNLVEMGIVRDVQIDGGTVTVTITPTFSGCPALHTMQETIRERVEAMGVATVQVNITLSPPWTTEWIRPSGREKLRQFGVTPPPRHDGDIEIVLFDPVPCPYCGSENTSIKNTFGPTICRTINYCHNCHQAFEQFKPL